MRQKISELALYQNPLILSLQSLRYGALCPKKQRYKDDIMKAIQLISSSWIQVILIMVIALIATQLWASESGWEYDLGMGFDRPNGSDFQGNLRVQGTTQLRIYRIGAEMKFPMHYSTVKDDSFLSIGIMGGVRGSLLAWKIEPMLAITIGPHALLYMNDKTDIGMKFVVTRDYSIKYWVTDYTAFYLNYIENHYLGKQDIGTVGFGMSFLSD